MTSAAPSAPHNADVTVVVTCFNHQGYIEQCLDSIAAQTQPPKQVIVIDDRSADDSVAVIQNWLSAAGVDYTFIRHERNIGLCATLNEALAMAEGKFFCHVSGDDWDEPDRFENQVAAFELADPNAALLVGDIREVDGGGGTIVDHDFGRRLGHMAGPEVQAQLLTQLLAENVIPAPGVLLRTDLAREAGGFDESLAFEDYDMWLRLSTKHSLAYLPGVVANYRVVASSMFRSPARRVSMLSSEAEMLAKHIGETPEKDAVIAGRLVRLAGDVLLYNTPSAVHRVLVAATSASHEPWLKRAASTSRLPGGLKRIRKRYWANLGLEAPVKAEASS